MNSKAIADLVDDADLVAETGIRLGRFTDPAPFLAALAAARSASDQVTPDLLIDLQRTLNKAVLELAPITLFDLKAGWRPFQEHQKWKWTSTIFIVLCVLTLILTGYGTQLYDRLKSMIYLTEEIQRSKSYEMAVGLHDLIKRAKIDSIVSSESPNPASRDQFLKKMFELTQEIGKYESYLAINNAIEGDLQAFDYIFAFKWVSDALQERDESSRIKKDCSAGVNSNNYESVYKSLICQYSVEGVNSLSKAVVTTVGGTAATGGESMQVNKLLSIGDRCEELVQSGEINDFNFKDNILYKKDQVYNGFGIYESCKLYYYFQDMRNIMNAMNIGIEGFSHLNHSDRVHRLKNAMTLLGNWMLPLLYGSLGASLFQMRRMLDPGLPNLSAGRLFHRILLGGFSGVIVVWFLISAATNTVNPNLANFTAFGIAFLFGFSADVFFKFIERMVSTLGDAVGKSAR